MVSMMFRRRVPGEAGVIHGTTKNAAHAADRTQAFERGERAMQHRKLARSQERSRLPEQGLALGM
jgi:hypothetical protein